MKYIVSFILAILCFPLGQLAHKFVVQPYYEDKIAREEKRVERENIVEVLVSGPGGKISMKLDLRELKKEDLPEKVTLTKRVTVTSEDGTSVTLGTGTKVIVKGIEGSELLVGAMSGPLEGRARIIDTDLPKQVANARAAELFGIAVNEGGGDAPTPAPGPGPKPPIPPVVDNGGGDNPPMPSPPIPEPEPEPEPEPAAGLTAEQITALMQENIKGGGVKEFKFEEVKGWQAGEEEDIDNETYQTGLAAYQAVTIFGPKTVQAKALIKGGKIVKWVYAKTGMEIR